MTKNYTTVIVPHLVRALLPCHKFIQLVIHSFFGQPICQPMADNFLNRIETCAEFRTMYRVMTIKESPCLI